MASTVSVAGESSVKVFEFGHGTVPQIINAPLTYQDGHPMVDYETLFARRHGIVNHKLNYNIFELAGSRSIRAGVYAFIFFTGISMETMDVPVNCSVLAQNLVRLKIKDARMIYGNVYLARLHEILDSGLQTPINVSQSLLMWKLLTIPVIIGINNQGLNSRTTNHIAFENPLKGPIGTGTLKACRIRSSDLILGIITLKKIIFENGDHETDVMKFLSVNARDWETTLISRVVFWHDMPSVPATDGKYYLIGSTDPNCHELNRFDFLEMNQWRFHGDVIIIKEEGPELEPDCKYESSQHKLRDLEDISEEFLDVLRSSRDDRVEFRDRSVASPPQRRFNGWVHTGLETKQWKSYWS